MKKSISIVVSSAVVIAAACLAWSPSSPTTLGGGANDQVQPKVAPTTDGGFCMSWFDNATGGYDVRVNRFNGSGAPMWGSNGVLVADRSYSSTVDYGSWVCTGNKFAVAYNDDRLGGDRISVSLLSEAGAIEWTTTIDPLGAFVANPKVCQDPLDGFIYAAWYQGTNGRVQKFDPATGVAQWATAVVIADATAQTTPADLWPAADSSGGVMVSAVRQVGFTGAKTLKAFRVSSAGVLGWTAGSTAPSVVFSTGSLQIGNFPNCQSIPGVGYVFCWYTSSPLQCWVQVLSPTGVARFAATTGSAVTATTTLNRVNPAFAADGPSDRVYVVFPENVPNSSTYTVAAQSFALSGTGTRLWGESAKNLMPTATLYSADFTAVRCHGGATFAWQASTAFGQDSLYARRLNDNGSDAWTSGTVLVDTATDKGKMVSYRQANAAVFVWSDGATGNTDIKGQSVGNDGTVGANPAMPGDINSDGVVNGQDLAALLAAWGSAAGGAADTNQDGIVDGVDLATVLANWT